MNCEEFELIGLESHNRLAASTDAAQIAAAAEHAGSCSRCAALADSWQQARAALSEFREATQSAQTPQRVEIHLLHEFASRQRSWWSRSTAVFGAWALATATLIFGAVSYWNWRVAQNHPTAIAKNHNSAVTSSGADDQSTNSTLVADNEAGDFTMLPGSLPQETDEAAIVRVRMQRGALTSLGLPVNEERLSDWIQVDLLVGQDGQPKAVRLPESAEFGSTESNF